MKIYEIIFQDSETIMKILAKSNSDARAKFNKSISIKLEKGSDNQYYGNF